MTIAAERLAVIAALTLPITSLSSVAGMNVIVNDQTHWVWLGILLLIMLIMSLILLRWARKQAGGDPPTFIVWERESLRRRRSGLPLRAEAMRFDRVRWPASRESTRECPSLK
jgi:H+/Cl- antiporter ClcA